MPFLAGFIVLLWSSTAAVAQTFEVRPGPLAHPATERLTWDGVAERAGAGTTAMTATAGLTDVIRTPGGAFAASLVLPGAGQANLGARRWVAYGALEVGLWTLRLTSLADQRRATDAYRDVAWEVARLPGPHPRQEGSWGYYETLSSYARSGGYDLDPAEPGIQPEDDPATYNGTVWSLARSLYLPGGEGGPGTPGYARALEYYTARAASPGYLWSWEGQEDSWIEFRTFIREADDASRAAGIALGAVLANHIVSAVDALIIARLKSESEVRLESRIASAAPLRWSLALRIPLQDQ